MYLLIISFLALLARTSCSPVAGNCLGQEGCLDYPVQTHPPVPVVAPVPIVPPVPIVAPVPTRVAVQVPTTSAALVSSALASSLDPLAGDESWKRLGHYALPSSMPIPSSRKDSENQLTCLGTAFPVFNFGGYEIYCGNQNIQITRLIHSSRVVLRRAMADLSGWYPGHGYEQLFKTIPPTEVKEVFRKVMAASGKAFPLGARLSPKVVCVNPQTIRDYKLPRRLYVGCDQPADIPRLAASVHSTPYILICAPFFRVPVLPSLPQEPPRSELCPIWNPATQQISRSGPTAKEFLAFQTFSFLYECIHFHTAKHLSRSAVGQEVYELDEITKLSESRIRSNAANYEIYAASKSIHNFTLHLLRSSIRS